MKKSEQQSILSGPVLDDDVDITLAELCRACRLPAEHVVEMVEYGVIEPASGEPGRWRFRAISLRRVRSAQRLQRDLGVNTAGVALVLDLLEEMEQLRTRLRRLESEKL